MYIVNWIQKLNFYRQIVNHHYGYSVNDNNKEDDGENVEDTPQDKKLKSSKSANVLEPRNSVHKRNSK